MKTMKKILLVVPPVILRDDDPNFNVNFPIGLGYLGAVLEKAAYEVEVLDALIEKLDQQIPLEDRKGFSRVGMTYDEIKQYVTESNPDCVCVTSMFTKQFENTLFVCHAVKESMPEVPVIVGGAHVTAAPESVLDDKSINYAVVGEAEDIIVPLLEAMERGDDVEKIDNVCYIDKQGKKIVKPVNAYPDVTTLPFPARHLFQVEKYITAGERHGGDLAKGVRSLNILTARGCPFKCNFCSAYQSFGHRLRNRPVESILEEVDELVNRYKVNDIYLTDDQFLADRKRVIRILEDITSRNYNLTLDAPNGLSPWLITEEILIKMKKAGFNRVQLAVESGDEWVLKNIINKPVKIDRLPEVVSLSRKHGLEVGVFLVMGNVSENAVETFDQMETSFKLMRRLGIRWPVVSYLSPHLGTEVYEVAYRKGYIDDNYLDEDYDKPCISTPLWSNTELQRFVWVQRALCLTEGHFLFFWVKYFVQWKKNIMLKERYAVLYQFISAYRVLRKLAA